MANSDGAILLATTRWSDEQYYLHEVVKRGELPSIGKIVKGHYLNLGVPSLPNPGLSSTVFLSPTSGKCVRVAAQCIKFKDGQRTINVGPKLAIPESFEGFFEILNEGGKAMRCIETVMELARKFPDSCLVRENIKAFVSRSDNVDTITERSRTIAAGELLVLVGEVGGPTKNRGHVKFLRCFDSRGENVFLPLDARGKFSPIAKEDNIGGVHSLRNLLNKRLPLIVRMVSGKVPAGLKVGQQFTYEMRLLAPLEEQMVVAMPLMKDGPVAVIPSTVSLKFQIPMNGNSVKQSKEFLRLQDRCLQKLREVADLIQVCDATFSKNLRFDGQQWRLPVVPQAEMPGADEATDKDATVPPEYDEIDQIYDYIRGMAPLPKSVHNSYDVTHEGANQRTADNNRRNALSRKKRTSPLQKSNKPEPPPLESLPSRKTQQSAVQIPVIAHHEVTKVAGHRDSYALPAQPLLFRKSNIHPAERAAKPRMFRQKSAMIMRPVNHPPIHPVAVPMILTPTESKQSLTPSPIFHMRYKSLNNLLAAADSDTLGSSQSGGRCSGGSAGSAAVRNPPHYIRHKPAPILPQGLHRPRSLTNLLFDARCGKQVQQHPVVVADVIPSLRNARPLKSNRTEQAIPLHRLNSSSSGGGSAVKRNGIFTHL